MLQSSRQNFGSFFKKAVRQKGNLIGSLLARADDSTVNGTFRIGTLCIHSSIVIGRKSSLSWFEVQVVTHEILDCFRDIEFRLVSNCFYRGIVTHVSTDVGIATW